MCFWTQLHIVPAAPTSIAEDSQQQQRSVACASTASNAVPAAPAPLANWRVPVYILLWYGECNAQAYTGKRTGLLAAACTVHSQSHITVCTMSLLCRCNRSTAWQMHTHTLSLAFLADTVAAFNGSVSHPLLHTMQANVHHVSCSVQHCVQHREQDHFDDFPMPLVHCHTATG